MPRWLSQSNRLPVDLGATAAQVAIAWVLSRSAQVLTIPGMKTRKHLADNLGAAALQLSAGHLARIGRAGGQCPGRTPSTRDDADPGPLTALPGSRLLDKDVSGI